MLTDAFRTRLGAELKSLAGKSKAMGRFLRHVRLVSLRDVAGGRATDVILSMCYAKTTHGRLLQQFGPLESTGGRGLLLDAWHWRTTAWILCRPLVPKIWMKNDCTNPVLGS